MSRILRSFVAGVVMSALLVCSAAPALADTTTLVGNQEEAHSVPVLFDVMFLRPLGLMVTALGAVTFCAISPIMAITRPTDMGAPFQTLVMRPARYTWVDPLGYH